MSGGVTLVGRSLVATYIRNFHLRLRIRQSPYVLRQTTCCSMSTQGLKHAVSHTRGSNLLGLTVWWLACGGTHPASSASESSHVSLNMLYVENMTVITGPNLSAFQLHLQHIALRKACKHLSVSDIVCKLNVTKSDGPMMRL